MTPLDSFKNLLRRPGEKAHFDPVRNWLALLSLSSIALLCVLVWNVWAFNRIADGQALGDTVEMRVAPKDTFSFEEIETIFSLRADEAKKYETGAYTFTDPSL